MKNAFASSVIILLSMVCWITRIEAQENNNQSHVVQLTSENFWSVVQNEPCVFVKFYAPWCSHCNKMAKDFEKAAEELVGKAVFAEVDSTQEKELSDELKIEGYPVCTLLSIEIENDPIWFSRP
jgi:thioredoxin-like negative regulator of GroEL